MKPIVLIVDDEAAIVRNCKAILDDSCSGVCRVEIAQSGQEAMEIVDELMAARQDIAMVITDYSMPGMSGDLLIHELCDKLPLSTMVMMSAFDDADIIAKTVNAGRLDRFIAKPVQKQELIDLAYEVLKDFTLRKELNNKSTELVMASQMAKIGIIRVNYISGMFYLSDQWFSAFDFDKSKVDTDLAFYESLFQTKDRKVLSAIRLENQEMKGKNSYSAEMQMKDGKGNWRWVQRCLSAVDFDSKGRPIEFIGVDQDITEQKNREQLLLQAQEKSEILDNLAEQVTFLTPDMKVIWANRTPNGCSNDYNNQETCFKQWYSLETPCRNCVVEEAVKTGMKKTAEIVRDGRVDSMIAIPVKGEHNDVIGVVVSQTDITERKKMELRLAHAQQMESIGSLAAGIAHEINTPIQYIGDNISYLDKAFNRIKITSDKIINVLNKKSLIDNDLKDDLARVENCFRMIPDAIDDVISGVAHVSRIVNAMKDFSHPSVESYGNIDLNQIIKNAITVCHNEWKYVAMVNTSFQEDQLFIEAVPNSISQVLISLIINASHAIEEKYGQDDPSNGSIDIKTTCDDKYAILEITDNGQGIDPDIKSRIFDPFFTTKEVGKGTGQGLAIAYDVVVKKHAGQITVESELGFGTTFVLRLPLHKVKPMCQKEEELVGYMMP